MNVIIRTAEFNDSGQLTLLSNQLGYDAAEKDTHDRLSKILHSDEDIVFVAEFNNEVIGWIHGFYTLRIESEPFVEIGGFVVNSNDRNKGIGKKLMDHVIEWAKSKNCSKIRVRSNSIRTESHRFFEKAGFVLSKEQKIFDRKI